ncbi:MAG TPA: dihydroorotase [Clostridia bacterium]|nr:dihydroorotase [Clostridia bacterium]
MSILIKNGKVIDPRNRVNGFFDIGIKNGKIVEVTKEVTGSYDSIIDAKGKMVCPGFIDAHVHLRVPGQSQKETLVTGTQASLKGGFTTVATMPNTNPVIDTVNKLTVLKEKIKKEALINVLPIVSVTMDQRGEALVDFDGLANQTVAFSDDGMAIMDEKVLEEAFQKLPDNSIIISHCEDFTVSKKYTQGPWPCVAESDIVKRNLEVAKKYNKRIHIAHISCEDSLNSIIDAKKAGVKASCEITPHHFSLSSEIIDMQDPYSKVNPPIRSEYHRRKMIQGIKSGHVDIIATDHAPHEKESKEVSYEKASFGISGIEYAFPVAYTSLVEKENIPLEQIVDMMTNKPAEILGINSGSLSIDAVADLTIIDLSKEETIESEKFISKGKNTPFDGYKVKSVVEMTIKAGEIKYQRSEKNEY